MSCNHEYRINSLLERHGVEGIARGLYNYILTLNKELIRSWAKDKGCLICLNENALLNFNPVPEERKNGKYYATFETKIGTFNTEYYDFKSDLIDNIRGKLEPMSDDSQNTWIQLGEFYLRLKDVLYVHVKEKKDDK